MNLKSAAALGLIIGILGIGSSFASFALEGSAGKNAAYFRDNGSFFDNSANINHIGGGDANNVDVAGLRITGRILSKGLCCKRKNFNEGLKKDIFGDSGEGLSGLLGGGGGGGIATKARGTIKTPSARDVGMGAGGTPRSAADIMKVVRQRTPGLRHIYNKYLKMRPGFAGKVTLRVTIAPGGDIIRISIASSTTGYGEFDNAVKNAVKRWTFSKIKSGNVTVSIPFTFAE